MYKIEIKNASVRDVGYGLDVNGKPLSEIISTLLGTKVGEKTAFMNDELDMFSHNTCDVTVIIQPYPTEVSIEDDEYEYKSIKEVEDYRCEQFNEKNKKTDPEE